MTTEMVDHPDHDTLAAYSLGALGARETAAYDTHLLTCDSCRAYTDELVAVREMLALVPPELVLEDPSMTGETPQPSPFRPPAGRARPAARRNARTWLSVAAVAAAIVIGAFVIPNAVNNGSSSATPAPTGTVITQAGNSTSVGAILRLTPGATSTDFDLRLTNLPAGTTLTVVADLTDGTSQTAGRWQVPPDSRAGVTFELEHSIPVTVDRIRDLRVLDSANNTIVTLTVRHHGASA